MQFILTYRFILPDDCKLAPRSSLYRTGRQSKRVSSWRCFHDSSTRALCLSLSRTSQTATRRWSTCASDLISCAKMNRLADKISPYRSPLRNRGSWYLRKFPVFFLPITVYSHNMYARVVLKIFQTCVYVRAFLLSQPRAGDEEDGLVDG